MSLEYVTLAGVAVFLLGYVLGYMGRPTDWKDPDAISDDALNNLLRLENRKGAGL